MKRLESIEIEELDRVLAVSGQTMWVVSLEGTILEFTGALDGKRGFRAEELIGTPLRSIVHPEDLRGAVQVFESVAGGNRRAENFEIELRVVGKGGQWHDVRVTGSVLVRKGGAEPVVMGLTSDITRQKRAERALQSERTRFQRTFEQAPTGIVLVHIDEERGALIKGVNAEACRMGGREEKDLVGRWLTDGDITEIDEDALKDSLASSQAMLQGESPGLTLHRILKRPDGSRINIRIVVSALDADDLRGSDTQPINAIAHIEDVTAQRQAEDELQHQARHDSLTDLLNRRRFITLLTDRLDRGSSGHGGGALLMIDLDDFKQVNDEHGHIAGDSVLQEVARVLREELRDSDPVARLGGDEFAVLLPHTDLVGAGQVAQGLLECLEKTRIEIIESQGESFLPSVSIGAIMLDDREVDAEAALRDCDRAMYEAKRQGGGRFVVSHG